MRMGVLTAAVYVAFSLSATAVHAAGDPAAGESKAADCKACHGAKGNSTIMPDYPKLAGQNAAYLVAALKGFRDGSRTGGNAALMEVTASTLSDQDIADLAIFYSQQ